MHDRKPGEPQWLDRAFAFRSQVATLAAMITIVAALLVAILGALVYALAANPKAAELGRIAFFCGMFWLVEQAAHKALHF